MNNHIDQYIEIMNDVYGEKAKTGKFSNFSYDCNKNANDSYFRMKISLDYKKSEGTYYCESELIKYYVNGSEFKFHTGNGPTSVIIPYPVMYGKIRKGLKNIVISIHNEYYKPQDGTCVVPSTTLTEKLVDNQSNLFTA